MSFQGDSIFWVEVEKIVPNPFQPRREFEESKLQELAESIRMYGILQPLTVTKKEIQRDDGAFYSEYELIAGERRLRASKLAGLNQVPVIIRSGEQTEQEKLELAIIENVQREDLNSVDRALAFEQLAKVFDMSHSQIAKKIGRSREYVSNTLRLLLLPDYIQSALKQGDIMEGHARALLMVNDRPEELDTIFRETLLKKLSVREVERIVRKVATDKVRKKEWKNTDPQLIAIEKEFSETFGTRVQIQKTDYGGKLTIDYFAPEDLEKILAMVKHEAGDGVSEEREAKAAVSEELGEAVEDSDEVLEALEATTPLANQGDETPVAAPTVAGETASELEVADKPASDSIPEKVQEENPTTKQPEQKPKSDDADLYAIKNFGI